MKIAFYELEEWEKDYVKEKLPDHEIIFFDDKLDEHNVVSDAEALGVFIYSEVDEEVIEKMKNLKYIATMSTGFDHIALKTCKEKNIPVSNVPNYGENTVAEHAFGLILSISRKIPESVERTKKGDFSLDGLRGFDLKDKTIGVVGTGSIGKHVIRMAKGFEMNIIAFDPFPDNEAAKEMGFEYVDFDTLLSNSDIITLHAPLNDHTHHMINCGNIGKVKKGAVLINTARGGLIETECIINALKNGTLSAAGLDVLEDEAFIREEKQLLSSEFMKDHDLKVLLQEHMLLDQDNVIITPHNAFNSKEALQRILDTTIENIQKFAEGNPVNVVNE